MKIPFYTSKCSFRQHYIHPSDAIFKELTAHSTIPNFHRWYLPYTPPPPSSTASAINCAIPHESFARPHVSWITSSVHKCTAHLRKTAGKFGINLFRVMKLTKALDLAAEGGLGLGRYSRTTYVRLSVTDVLRFGLWS